MTESCSAVPENQTWKYWYLGYTGGKREIYRIAKSKKVTWQEKILSSATEIIPPKLDLPPVIRVFNTPSRRVLTLSFPLYLFWNMKMYNWCQLYKQVTNLFIWFVWLNKTIIQCLSKDVHQCFIASKKIPYQINVALKY